MLVITNKSNDRIIHMGTKTGETLAGYIIMDENQVFMPEFVYVYDVSEIPQEVTDNPTAYCYDVEQGFYNWIEPEPEPERYTLDEAAAVIASEVASDE